MRNQFDWKRAPSFALLLLLASCSATLSGGDALDALPQDGGKDAGRLDANGPGDSGSSDARREDTGTNPIDTGPLDSGGIDTGTPETGPQGPTCNNGVREGNEACDGADFGGASCQSRGFSGGTLSCNNCNIVDSACTNTPSNCIPCSGRPSLSRTYTDNEFIASGTPGCGDTGEVRVGITNGVHYVWQARAGAPLNRNVIYNCVHTASQASEGRLPASDIPYFMVEGLQHPANGWRPDWMANPDAVRRTYCDEQTVCASSDQGPVRARVIDGVLRYQVQRNGQWDDPQNNWNNYLLNLTGNCIEPSGSRLPTYSYLCFPKDPRDP